MPIVVIELLEDAQPEQAALNLQELTDDLGLLLGSAAAGTWVKLRYLPRTQYAENQTTVGPDVRPVFVEVLHGALPADDLLESQARAISALVARHLQRPVANVHVVFLPEGRGRIAFGGQLRR